MFEINNSYKWDSIEADLDNRARVVYMFCLAPYGVYQRGIYQELFNKENYDKTESAFLQKINKELTLLTNYKFVRAYRETFGDFEKMTQYHQLVRSNINFYRANPFKTIWLNLLPIYKLIFERDEIFSDEQLDTISILVEPLDIFLLTLSGQSWTWLYCLSKTRDLLSQSLKTGNIDLKSMQKRLENSKMQNDLKMINDFTNFKMKKIELSQSLSTLTSLEKSLMIHEQMQDKEMRGFFFQSLSGLDLKSNSAIKKVTDDYLKTDLEKKEYAKMLFSEKSGKAPETYKMLIDSAKECIGLAEQNEKISRNEFEKSKKEILSRMMNINKSKGMSFTK